LITYKDVSEIFADYGKNMTNQMQHMIDKSLAKSFKILNISADSPDTHVNQHASNSSATHFPLENPQFGMPLKYFAHQTPLVKATFPSKEKPKSSIVLRLAMVEPIISIPSLVTNS
jgi:hypothetical protein